MTVIGVDDTDSREHGMCTTYVAARLADRVRAAGGAVDRVLLVRLNPAVTYKTRGNAALAIHTDLDVDAALALAHEVVSEAAVVADDRTNPGVVVAPHAPADVPSSVERFSRAALRELHSIEDAHSLADEHGYLTATWKNGRGIVGALAAVGAWTATDDWTYECIAYREPERWGTPRAVTEDSLFAAADEYYPVVWDTVDRGERETVCVPHTPGPILHGIRGDDPDAVLACSRAIESEPVTDRVVFQTNQGTDAHLVDVDVDAHLAGIDVDAHLADSVADDHAYRVTGTVTVAPATRQGGHVFFTVDDLDCVAFEPTKRFRALVRDLCVDDRVTVCGEVTDGTLKLEKFALRARVTTERVTPTCPDCGRRMKSAGATQGYRCRDCGTTTDEKATVAIDRDLELGWYEVPPCARRHIAKPLIRGGFDAPVHPER